jgi:hypothetical protein
LKGTTLIIETIEEAKPEKALEGEVRTLPGFFSGWRASLLAVLAFPV